MERIDGVDLDLILARYRERHQQPLPWPLAAQIAMQICSGLHHAHTKTDEQGQPLHLIHRDLKPANLLLTSTGNVKIIDFGIAKASSNLGKTATGIIRGTPFYMSPEQIQDPKGIDGRADLFSLGIVLYELCSGHKPFVGSGPNQVLFTIVKQETPPLEQYGLSLPEAIQGLIFRLLQKDPEQRPGSAQETRGLLKGALVENGVHPDRDTLSQLYRGLVSNREEAISSRVTLAAPTTAQEAAPMQATSGLGLQEAPRSTLPYGADAGTNEDTRDDLPSAVSAATAPAMTAPASTAPALQTEGEGEYPKTELMLDLSHIQLPPNAPVDPHAPTALLSTTKAPSSAPPPTPPPVMEETKLLWQEEMPTPPVTHGPSERQEPQEPQKEQPEQRMIIVALGVSALLFLAAGLFLLLR